VVIAPGRFAGNPAVQGLMAKYPLYFQALIQRDSTIVRRNFPEFFYGDTAIGIDSAKAAGWVMRPPGSLVVMAVEPRPDGVVRIRSCRSQSTQYWNPKARRWARVTPGGAPDVIDMVQAGQGWTMYRWVRPVPRPFSCAKVRYPA
jgi:hypothetical protein